ncbi:carboxymuconolactone decarboxylase family protein [Ectothiorhodospira shaposhnikovii]|uniref:carboxymuconolactone decarboxylase family protein n=1 Tax=Ectothiorhodospira shaposhnikovii TaxID=1054 RepID=UPI0039A019C8
MLSFHNKAFDFSRGLFTRWFLGRQRRVHGAVLAPSWLWGRLPGAFIGMLVLLAAFQRRSYPIDTALRSLVSIRIAQLNGCRFCVDLNAHNFLKARGEESKANAVAQWRSGATANCFPLANGPRLAGQKR